MSTISGVSAASYYPIGATGNAASDNTAATPGIQNGNLAALAASLSFSAGVVGSLNGASGAIVSASSLLDSFINAGQKPASSTAPAADPGAASPAANTASASSPDSSAASAAGTDGDAPAPSSGIYNSNGVLQTLDASNSDANWASLLKANPGMAADAAAYTFNQGILNTLA